MDERERVIPKQERGIEAGGVFFRQMAVLMEKKALSLVMVVALLATSFLQLRASMDFPAEDGEGSEGEACCDQCICTRSIPPQCRCTDVKSYCHSSCKGCLCTRSIPPQCRCTDIKDSCDNECTATGF